MVKKSAGKMIKTTGSVLDVRLALIRTDFNPKKHGDTLSFWGGDEPCFQSAKGKVDYDCQSALWLFGFDEPEDGMAVALNSPDGNGKLRYGEDTGNLETDIAKLLEKHFVPDTAVAKAISSIVKTVWGFGCDLDEVEEESLSKLEDFKWHGESGSDQLPCDDIDFPCGGAILIEAVVCSDVPGRVAQDGTIEFSEDLDWDDYRGERLIMVLAPQFKTKIAKAGG